MTDYLAQFVEIGKRKGTEATVFCFDHGESWHFNIKTKILGAELTITNVAQKDFFGGLAEIVERFNTLAPREFRGPQIEHKPSSPPPFIDINDEIPF